MNAFMKIFGSVLRVLKTPLKLWTQAQKLTAVVTGLGVILAGLATTTVVLHANEPGVPETTAPSTNETTVQTDPSMETTETTTGATTEGTTVPQESQPVINDKVLQLQEMLKENPETYGWIMIPNTRVDEVVMFSPERPDFYLYSSYQGWFSAGGTAYIDEVCAVDPETQVLQIYAHNMLSGAHFGTLNYYAKQEFWEENPYIYFTTINEARTYEVVSASYMPYIKAAKEGEYRFSDFITYSNKAEFDEHIQHFLDTSVIDTGVVPEYLDTFIMLVTCYGDHDRFIVLARETTWVEPEVE